MSEQTVQELRDSALDLARLAVALTSPGASAADVEMAARVRGIAARFLDQMAERSLEIVRPIVNSPPLSPRLIASLDQSRRWAYGELDVYGIEPRTFELGALVLGQAGGMVAAGIGVDKETKTLTQIITWSLGIRPQEPSRSV